MSIYGDIGFTRKDNTPPHWREGYKLTKSAKEKIRRIDIEKERLFREHESLSADDNLTDEEFNAASAKIAKELDELIEKEDKVRRENKK